ncbi:hypothetical protein HanPI659440_Chr12g0459351 [Helianthus annuus]|nr:hypothetical protein HanPI659440_Chr12g0459351 [Helianthus annuus]
MSCHTSSLYCNQPPLHQRNRTKKGKVERENVQAVMVLTTVVLKSHSCHFTLQFKLPDPLQSPYMDPFSKQRSRQSSADSQEGSSITYLQPEPGCVGFVKA